MSRIVELLQELKQYEWVELSHSIDEKTPHYHDFNPARIETKFEKNKDGYFAKEYSFIGQYGTHIDSPIHFSTIATRYNDDLLLDELILPLYVLHLENKVAQNPDYRVQVTDILDFEEKYGQIKPHTFVAFASNWSKRFDDEVALNNIGDDGINHTPGWSLEALQFLVEKRNITAIGHETLDTDSGVDAVKNQGLIAEQYLLDQDRYQVEVLKNLDVLPATGAVIFNLMPRVKEAPGFPVRSFAIKE